MSRCFVYALSFFLSFGLAYAANEDGAEMPDAKKHMVTAPPFDVAALRDPFSSFLDRRAATGRSILDERRARLAKRAKEPLEEIDLASLNLVAVFQIGEDRLAVVEDTKGKGYSVRRGNYMGRDNGRVEKITSKGIYLVEQILDAAGDIVDRQREIILKDDKG